MKKILIHIFLLFLIMHTSHATIQETMQERLLENNGCWEKTKEERFFQQFSSLKNPQEKITIILETRESDPYLMKKYGNESNDLCSLLEHEELSSLQRMKELRLESKKIISPYAVWKLLYVFNENDIIYEYTVPHIGPYTPSYNMTRLIKTDHGYLKITYSLASSMEKPHSTDWFEWLKTLPYP